MPEERHPRAARAPRDPTPAEREEHNRFHWPPRSWCVACQSARCVASPHSSSNDGRRQGPTVAFDYCYPGASREDLEGLRQINQQRADEGRPAIDEQVPAGSKPTIVAYESQSGALYALVVGRKGASHDAIARAVWVLDDLGHKEVVIKSD